MNHVDKTKTVSIRSRRFVYYKTEQYLSRELLSISVPLVHTKMKNLVLVTLFIASAIG